MSSIYKYLNPTINLLLKSPLHNILSSRLMSVEYRGRKSGKFYTTPVSYYHEGNTIYCFTNGSWWHNFKQSTPVSVQVKGQLLKGNAIAEAASIEANTEIMARYFKAVKADAKFYGVSYDNNGEPIITTVKRAAMGMVMICISLL